MWCVGCWRVGRSPTCPSDVDLAALLRRCEASACDACAAEAVRSEPATEAGSPALLGANTGEGRCHLVEGWNVGATEYLGVAMHGGWQRPVPLHSVVPRLATVSGSAPLPSGGSALHAALMGGAMQGEALERRCACS